MTIKLKIGDDVKLYNGTEGTVTEIYKSTYRLQLGNYLCHLQDVSHVNGLEIEVNDKYLTL